MTSQQDKEFLESIKERLTDGEWNYIRKSLTKVEIIRNQSHKRSKKYYEKISKSKKHYCEVCDKYLSTKQVLKNHKRTEAHIDKKNIKENIQTLREHNLLIED